MDNTKVKVLSDEECDGIYGGEVITIALVTTVLVVSVLCIVCWKLFTSSKGNVTIPGGFKFGWGAIKTLSGI